MKMINCKNQIFIIVLPPYALTAAGTTPSNPRSTNTYTYATDGWGDRLTAYNGTAITYDDMGNPVSYSNGAGSYTFTWSGRQATTIQKGPLTYYLTYNDEGMRTSKTVNGVTTTYYVSGTQILAEETSGNITVYLYDSEGAPLGMQYHGVSYEANVWDIFWYERNVFGDIVAIYDEAGTLLATYNYDAYGVASTLYYNGGSNTRAFYNPFRYRGYYYDRDLSLYYLSTRYYDCRTGRFVSPDNMGYLGANGDLNSYNLYAYCSNNPIEYEQRIASSNKIVENDSSIYTLITRYQNSQQDNFPPEPPSNLEQSFDLPCVEIEEDGQLIRFDFSKAPDFNIHNSFYYVDQLYKIGLPDDRTYAGVWLELYVHYIVHKLDTRDLIDNDDVADMGSFKKDDNAWIFEFVIESIRTMGGV